MRNERGITIIALVISIVVILILATIAINIAIGDNGIFRNTNTAKIMNKVQALDDTIKAYTLKSKDPYSSSKKTINDLISEGILIKIVLTGEDLGNESDDKSLYYVNFENKDISVTEILGLEKNEYENIEKLSEEVNESTNTITYSKLADLQKKGIYVVDNDLNAAYLRDDKTYGKLINFGVQVAGETTSEFASQTLKLSINPKSGVANKQEIIMVIDRTVSMALADNAGKNSDNMPIIKKRDNWWYETIDYTASYQKTRWYGATVAMDRFIDSYFEENSSGNKKLTIFTFYGRKDDKGIESLGTFTNAVPAKSSYSNIFSQSQFTEVVNNYFDRHYNSYNISCQYANGMTGSGMGYYGSLKPGSLGNYTCTPNALNIAYEYIKSNLEDDVQYDVIIMADGDSNEYWSPCTRASSIGDVSNKIMSTKLNIKSEERYPGVYAVGFGQDTENFQGDFGGNYSAFYTSENSENLAENFQEILETIKQGFDAITNTENSHSIMTKNVETGELEEYDFTNGGKNKVNEIVIELTNSNDSSQNKTMIFNIGGTGVGGKYPLENIYEAETGHILLENAWIYSGISPGELNNNFSKAITVYTD